jgi:2-polyprenyl-6-methoxyphenol hydroxylase-like FAD-dependent oxidoreductase
MRENRLAHAIVLGGSAAGLLAARVLAPHAERVTLVERDALPDAALHRKGTPQSRHANNLHPRAMPLLEAWFPGVTDELERAGAGAVPVTDEARAVIRGLRFAHTHGAPKTLLLTRPLLDAILRRRVRALGNVSFATECHVTGLCVDRAGNVAGALLRNEHGEAPLAGELVVDAMGRGTRARRWLSAFGYAVPSVTELRVNVHYASRLFSRAAVDLQGDKLAMISPTVEIPRGAVAFAVEGDRWLVTLFEYGGETPPTELSEFCAFARTLVADDIGELLAGATALDDGAEFAFPTACLRRFDKLRAIPDGYLCLGDSLCQLNPSYGQGITSAVLQAAALAKALARGRRSLPRRYYRLAVKAASQPFNLSWSSDLDLPSVVAPPNPTPALIRAYAKRARRVARHDPAVALAMRRIIGLVDSPPALLRPSIAFRVLFGNAEAAPRDGHSAAPISVVWPGRERAQQNGRKP